MNRILRKRRFFLPLLVLTLSACSGNDDAAGPSAMVQTRIEILKTEDMPGTYGAAGAYEKVRGRLHGEVDPKDRRNTIIQGLEAAPINARGMVEYSTDFLLFKPKDMARANGVMRYDAPNRGNNLAQPDPYFLSKGYVYLASAWQGDVPASTPERMVLQVPVARNQDGSSITGLHRVELTAPTATQDSMSLPGGSFNASMLPYAPASLNNTEQGYRLSMQINHGDEPVLIAPSEWRFARCDAANPWPGIPDGASLCLKAGWNPLAFYELVYRAKDPKVLGVGLAALRDTVEFFHHARQDSAGTANPLAGAIKHVLGMGTSQAGNFMKTFVHLGFNQGIQGAKVFDGVFAQVAARLTSINMRFATPGSGGGYRLDNTALGQMGPRGLAADYQDSVSGRNGGVLSRCNASSSCPKLFVGLSGSEFFVLQGSPMLTDALGTRDLQQPDNARIYYYASSHHYLGLPASPGALFGGIYPLNANVGVIPIVRALEQNLEDWVVLGKTPPPSQVPRVADGTLVPPKQVNFPSIPQGKYTGLVNGYALLDGGPQFRPQDESGVLTQVPPVPVGPQYAILAPQVDADGNDIAGIRSLDIAVPLATQTGWNYTNLPGITDLASLAGSYFPFAKTMQERTALGDIRLSLQERYLNTAGYVSQVRAAAADLVNRRFLLPQDAQTAIDAAALVNIP